MHSAVHFEIPTADLQRAKKFYGEVFGWQMFDFDSENTMVATTDSDERGMPKKPGAINGSIYLTDKSKTPTVVMDVPDINRHLQIIKEHGGEVVDEPATIPGMGMYARFRDPEGNLMGLWQSVT